MKRGAASVPRETLVRLGERWDLSDTAVDQLGRLLLSLAAEPDPPTTVREPEQAAEAHVADSLAGLEVAELRSAARIADIGAGAGFPGLVLAAALPEASVDLVESARRKCELIDRLAEAAGLRNARSVPRRAEEWGREAGALAYDAVTARALAALPVLAEYAAPLLVRGGVLVAWKGARDPAEEAAGARAAAEVGLEPRAVLPSRPYPASRNRHLHVYTRVADTPPRFPRRPGVASRRPLG